MTESTKCRGCGIMLPRTGGPTHAYVATTPECWALFSEYQPQQPERLFIDAYMVQHPDGDDPRQVQSVASHLIALESVLVEGQPRSKTAQILVVAVELGRELGGFPSLRRPEEWNSTIGDVLAGSVTPTRYVEGVLESWHTVESALIGSWARQTLERLYA